MAGTYIDRMATGQARRQHGKPVTFAWDCLREMPDKAVDAAVSRDGRGEKERPQGGGGVDHPNKVQQRKAQTDRVFFCTPWAIVTLFTIPVHHFITGMGVLVTLLVTSSTIIL